MDANVGLRVYPGMDRVVNGEIAVAGENCRRSPPGRRTEVGELTTLRVADDLGTTEEELQTLPPERENRSGK